MEDYNLIGQIYKNLDVNMPRIFETFNLLTAKPQLWELNNMHKQRRLSEDILRKIKENFDLMLPKGKDYAMTIDKKLSPSFTRINVNI